MNAGPTFELTGGGVLVAVGLLVGGVLAYQAYSASAGLLDGAGAAVSQAAAKVGGWVNPASDQNLAYQGVSAAGSAYTGQADWNLGGAVYDTQQARGFSSPLEIFTASSAGLIAKELGDFFGWGSDPAPVVSGGGGVFTGTGATGSW